MAVGGLQKNDGTNNEDYSFTNTVISNRVVTLVKKDSKIKITAIWAAPSWLW